MVYLLGSPGGASNLIVDLVGYGTAANIYVEGTAAAAPASTCSIRRSLNATDSSNNNFTTTIPT